MAFQRSARQPDPQAFRSLDCSGYMRMLWGYRAGLPFAYLPDGVNLPRHSWEIAENAPGVVLIPNTGMQVADLSAIAPGDLVFFKWDEENPHPIDHVGNVPGGRHRRTCALHLESPDIQWADDGGQRRSVAAGRHRAVGTSIPRRAPPLTRRSSGVDDMFGAFSPPTELSGCRAAALRVRPRSRMLSVCCSCSMRRKPPMRDNSNRARPTSISIRVSGKRSSASAAARASRRRGLLLGLRLHLRHRAIDLPPSPALDHRHRDRHHRRYRRVFLPVNVPMPRTAPARLR